MKHSLLFAAAPLALLAACDQKPAAADQTATLDAIHKVENAQIASFASRDAEAGVAPYTENSAFVASGMPYLEGLAKIRPAFEEMLADPNVKFEMTPKGSFVAASGDLAVTTSDYAYTHTDAKTKQPVTETGVNQTVWRKEADGSWKNVSDFNVSAPPAASE